MTQCISKSIITKISSAFKHRRMKQLLAIREGLGELIAYYPEYDREVSLNQVMIDKHLVVAYHGQSKKDVEDEHRKNWEILYEQGVVPRGE